MVRGPDNRYEFRCSVASRADGLDREAIGSHTEIFLAAPIGRARRKLRSLPWATHQNLVNAATSGRRAANDDRFFLCDD